MQVQNIRPKKRSEKVKNATELDEPETRKRISENQLLLYTYAFNAYIHNCEKVLRFLEEKCDPNTVDPELKTTPLHHVAEIRCLKCCKTLLEFDANVNAQDSVGTTPFMIACHNNLVDVYKLFIEHGADMEIKNHKGRTALHFAFGKEYLNASYVIPLRSHFECLHLLIDSGANVNAESCNGATALHSVAKIDTAESTINVLIKLLQYGARVEASTSQDETPFVAAFNTGNLAAIVVYFAAGYKVPYDAYLMWLQNYASKNSDLEKYVSDQMSQPISLKNACRKIIVLSIGTVVSESIFTKLTLPKVFLAYLQYEDLYAICKNKTDILRKED